MITTELTFLAPRSVAGITEALASAPASAVVLGGGTMLVPDMTHGHTRPGLVVDIGRAGLDTVRFADRVLHLGAGVTYAALLADPTARSAAPLLRRVAAGVTGGPQIRNRGTFVGSACYANPSSDAPGALVASDAVFVLESAGGSRTVAAAEFVTGAFSTVRRPDEVLTGMRLPVPPPTTGHGYVKLKLSESSWPIATASAVVPAGAGARITLGAVSPVPVTLTVDPPAADGPDDAWRQRLAEAVEAAVPDWWADALADADYRRAVAPVVAERAVVAALADLADRGEARG